MQCRLRNGTLKAAYPVMPDEEIQHLLRSIPGSTGSRPDPCRGSCRHPDFYGRQTATHENTSAQAMHALQVNWSADFLEACTQVAWPQGKGFPVEQNLHFRNNSLH